MAQRHQGAALAWLEDAAKPTSTDDTAVLGTFSVDAPSILQMEAVSACLGSTSQVDHKYSRSRAALGRSVHGAPMASEWSQDFTAERRRCGNQIRKYKFKVAQGYFVAGDSFLPVAKPAFSTPRRTPPLMLPQAELDFMEITSRPSSRARKNKSPILDYFPAMTPARSLETQTPDFEEEVFNRQTKEGRHSTREPSFVNNRPWMCSSPKPGLLVRKEADLGPFNPELHVQRETKSKIPSKDIPKTGVRPSVMKSPASPVEGPGVAEAPDARDKPKKAAAVVPEGHASVAETSEKDGKGARSARRMSQLKIMVAEGGEAQDGAKGEAKEAKKPPAFANIPEGKEESDRRASLTRQNTPPTDAPPKQKIRRRGSALAAAQRKSVLWHINLKDAKQDRMGRINDLRRIKAADAHESPGGYRNRISKVDAEIALESFLRHFPSKTSSPWNTEDMIEALADFGIQAQNKNEKVAIFSILKDFAEDTTAVGFAQFCHFIEECRTKLRGVRSMVLFQAWKRHDSDDSGTMDQGEVLALLEEMGFTPKPGDAQTRVLALISEATEGTGTVTFNEVEYLMSSVREYLIRSQRKQERDIQAKEDLAPALFKEFRSQLLSYYTCFTEFDDDNSGTLDEAEILNLLQLFGCLSNSMEASKRLLVQEMAERQLAVSPTRSLRFSEFVRLIKNLRHMEMEEKSEAIRELFSQYDKDNSGDLSIKEICQVLMDLQIQPRSFAEQEAMAQLIDEADADGSGELNAGELLFLVQKICEKKVELRRKEEFKIAKALNFTLDKVNEFRLAFDTLDLQGDGYLSVSEVWSALAILRWKITDSKFARLMEEVDDDGSGELDFAEFLTLLRKVEDERNPVKPTSLKADEEKEKEQVEDRTGRRSSTGGPNSGMQQAKKQSAPSSSAMPGLLNQKFTQMSDASSGRRKSRERS